ncbi:dicarboxylate/amino acid:cation symporter [Shouchella lonarensis]|uniref:Na+/H+-dicarboxylate symporter n=1 Tax=Shouchella lonarensis TaxID=1464122 RepID=A0A1G6GVT9_9BACI|nr:dicarboxylate/amino acid:cation symporter [Shouchella lonarensis]SDB86051.1 Na+/H+-dicarboxylate symporter [Shouchella lonarensis]
MHQLTTRILIALVLGAVTGLALNQWAPDLFQSLNQYVFDPAGNLFLRLIMMLVVPLVFLSIVVGVSDLGSPKQLGRMGLKTVAFFLGTTVIALTLALTVATIVQPGDPGLLGEGLAENYEAAEAPPFIETLVNIIPNNPIEAMSSGAMLQIIAFAIFVGLAMAVLGEKVTTVKSFFKQGNDIMMTLVTFVMKFAPIGAFALIASALGQAGWSAVFSLGAYMLTVVGVLLIHVFGVYSLLIYFFGKMNPLTFYKGFFPAMTMAFSLSSSNATLPLSMKIAQENLGVSKQVSGFVQPLGATINMDGTGIMQAVATVFIAQVYVADLSLMDMVVIVLTATLASIGTAGVPGVGMIMLAMVLTQVGLSPAGIALVIGVDRLLDMLRTSVNITGDAALAVIVDRSEKRRGALPSHDSGDV